MPSSKEFEFGKRAVDEGLLTQSHLEEAVELLHSLERVGSDKRLWDVILEHGWLREADVARLRGRARGASEIDPGLPSLPPEDLPGTYLLAHIKPQQEPTLIQLKHRPMSIGSDTANDIVLTESLVEMRHARMTFADGGPRLWDMGSEAGVLVNGVRRRSHDLKPFDLVRIGEAMLVVCYSMEGDGETPEPVSPTHAVGALRGRFTVQKGNRSDETFYLGQRGLVFGRHRLASVRLNDGRVGALHAIIYAGKAGVEVVDLRSPFGTAINGNLSGKGKLKDGDTISVGDAVLRFQALNASGAAAAPASAPAAKSVPRTAPAIPPPEEEKKENASAIFDIPLDAELDVDHDENDPFGLKKGALAPYLMSPEKAGAPGPLEETHAEGDAAPPAKYELGEVCLVATSGPIKGQFLPVCEAEMTMGRGNEVTVTIPDLSVSRQHAKVTLSDDGLLEVADCGSRNGVVLNGRTVTRAALRVGDTIKLGTTVLRVEKAQR